MAYTTIDHTVRKEFGLTLNEYAICDSIYYLSRGGVCTASKEYLGEFIGIKRRAVHAILKKLQEKNLIEKVKGGIRTTTLWDHAVLKMHGVEEKCAENAQSSVRKVHSECAESAHNNNSIDTDNKRHKETAFFNAVNKYFYENSNTYHPSKREGMHIYQLEKKLKTFEAFLPVAEFYRQLTLSDDSTRKWWRDQPFIPSAMNTLLPRIQTIMQKPAPRQKTMKEIYG